MLTDTLTPAALLDAPTPQDVAGPFALWIELNRALDAVQASPEAGADLLDTLSYKVSEVERVAMAKPAAVFADLQRQVVIALATETLGGHDLALLRQAQQALGLPPAS